MTLYPLKFHPILKDRIWGGSRLKSVLHKPLENDGVGESWEVSGVSGDVSIIANGSLAGRPLTDLLRDQATELMGKSVVKRFGKEFPVLIKFLDANQDLSIQVHPDDQLAMSKHQSNGKTEMWYIMDAEQDATLIIGFNRDVTPQEYIARLKENKVEELLQYEKISEGDAFFISAGRIHAIGAGVLLAEIQQTSDITYRVFDYNRKDQNGKLRDLHTDLAMDALDYKKTDDYIIRYPQKDNVVNRMVSCPYFTTGFLKLTETYNADLSERDSFTILMCVDGEASIANEIEAVSIKKGETILLPACSSSLTIDTRGVSLLEITL